MASYTLNLNSKVDNLLEDYSTEGDELQSLIKKEILFKYNSVNLFIGRRGSGKTHTAMKEALKISLFSQYFWNRANEAHSQLVMPVYTQIYYITDKVHDDTFNKFKQYIEDTGVKLSWDSTDNAITIIRGLAVAKATLTNPESSPEDIGAAREALTMKPCMVGNYIPHTLVIFDDCIGLFKRDSALSKLLFENRQSRITYMLLLQDVQGISPSMKSNIDLLVLFGGFPKNKWNILMYQMPVFDNYTFDNYVHLYSTDFVVFDYIANTYSVNRPQPVNT